MDPGAKFWVHGLFGPKFKKCNFLIKPYNMGVYGLAWTPAFIFETIWTLGPNFGSKGPLVQIKNCNFLQNPTKWVSMKLPGPPSNHFRVIWTLGPTFESTGPLPSFGISVVQFFDLNCRPTSHLPLTWATLKVDTIMSS